MSIKPKAYAPKLALFSAALIWGSSFVITKNMMDSFPVNYWLAIRFSLSFLTLAVIFRKRLSCINRDYLLKTAVMGFCLYLAYILQTVGIKDTTPGKNAFLTAVYVILVPFLYWAAGKKKPSAKNLAAALVCLAGIGLISLVPPEASSAVSSVSSVSSAAAGNFLTGLSIGTGDAFTLAGGFFFAAHIVLMGLYTRDKDIILLTILQFGFCAVYFAVTGICFETPPRTIGADGVVSLLYMTFFCTALAMFLQNYGQKYTHPSAAALLMSLEAIFGVLFSVLFYDEVLTLRLLAGFGLVFAAVLISETGSKA